MGQRVNIQYSIEVEQLPSEVSRLMKEVENQFKQMTFQPSTKKGDVEISLESISKINSLRQSLAAIDHGLMDVSNIMTGYINFVTTQEEESQEEVTEIEEVAPTEQDIYESSNLLGTLEEKLNNFKNNRAQSTHDQISPQKHNNSQQVAKPSI